MYFLEQALNGLSLGAMYAFIALGYTMVYGIVKLINFAHGEFFMIGAYTALFTVVGLNGRLTGLSWLGATGAMALTLFVAMLFAALASGTLAVLVERFAYRPLRNANRISALLAALGVSLFLQNFCMWVLSPSPRAWPDPVAAVAKSSIALGDEIQEDLFIPMIQPFWEAIPPKEMTPRPGRIPLTNQRWIAQGGEWEYEYVLFEDDVVDEALLANVQAVKGDYLFKEWALPGRTKKILVIVVLAISFAGLHILVAHTRMGRAMRAVSYNREAAKLMGIHVNRVIGFTFFIGAFLAGIGGLIWPILYGKVDPLLGFMPGLKAFIAAVIGGIGSIPGAAIGGLLLGFLESMLKAYLPSGLTGYTDAFAFAVLILVLLIKPSGILGKSEGEKI